MTDRLQQVLIQWSNNKYINKYNITPNIIYKEILEYMIYRLPKDKNFTQVHNNLINDRNLTTNAKAILIYMLSKNDDWQFYEKDITNHFQDNVKVIKKGIKELIDKGYVERTKMQDSETKRFVYIYDVYEQPELSEEE
jgi:predicted transcriptional regulator